MRRRWFLALKCGSGKQKKSFSSWPFTKKCGRYFIAFVRSTAAFCAWGGVPFRSSSMRSRTNSHTLGLEFEVGAGVWHAREGNGMSWVGLGWTPSRTHPPTYLPTQMIDGSG